MNNRKKSNIVIRVLMIAVYIAMIIPMVYSMWNSVPACDDFAFGAKSISDNLLLNALGFSGFCWIDHSGRWLTYFLQTLINPMNSHNHLGHLYGVWMIALFFLTFAIMYYSLRIILGKILEIDGMYLDLVLFLIFAVLFTTFYYVEVFNWYIGGTAYALPLSLLMLTLVYLIRYEETGMNKYYWGIIIAGIIPATNEIFDVPLGIMYLYILFIVFKNNLSDKKKIVKKLVPLFIFVLGGISVVFAPGNLLRQADYEVKPSAIVAAKQIVIDIIVRLKDVLLYHPLFVILMVCIFVVGIKSGKSISKNNILITMVITFISIFGSIFPYVYGRGMTTTYLDVRVQYLFDYMLFIGVAIGCFRLGRILSVKCSHMLQGRTGIIICSAMIVVAIAALSYNGGYKKIIQIDILDKKQLIADSYKYWDDIILEIENSADTDIVIERDEEPMWTPYFLYVGLVEEEIYNLPLDSVFSMDIIMPNVYYGKESIRYVVGE